MKAETAPTPDQIAHGCRLMRARRMLTIWKPIKTKSVQRARQRQLQKEPRP